MKWLATLVGKGLEISAVIILATMSSLVFLNVVLRYGFNTGISVTEEVSRYLFVWLTFLGAILAFNSNQHVNVTLLTEKLSFRSRKILGVLTDSVMLFCCYLIADGSWIQFKLNLHNLSPISELPQGITYLASLVASIIIAVLIVARLAVNFISIVKEKNQ